MSKHIDSIPTEHLYAELLRRSNAAAEAADAEREAKRAKREAAAAARRAARAAIERARAANRARRAPARSAAYEVKESTRRPSLPAARALAAYEVKKNAPERNSAPGPTLVRRSAILDEKKHAHRNRG